MQTFVITQAVIKHKSKYLLAKRASTKKNAPNKWEFISGFVDTKETTEQIILREMKEEIKLEGKLIKSANPLTIQDKEARWIIIPFLIEANTNKVTINPKDHSEAIWISKEELKKYKDLFPEIKYYEKLGWLK
ncbi:MAG: NUDIX domain-containing protein [Nanoarchaeota archaeon]